jgi:hypothetical protein
MALDPSLTPEQRSEGARLAGVLLHTALRLKRLRLDGHAARLFAAHKHLVEAVGVTFERNALEDIQNLELPLRK